MILGAQAGARGREAAGPADVRTFPQRPDLTHAASGFPGLLIMPTCLFTAVHPPRSSSSNTLHPGTCQKPQGRGWCPSFQGTFHPKPHLSPPCRTTSGQADTGVSGSPSQGLPQGASPVLAKTQGNGSSQYSVLTVEGSSRSGAHFPDGVLAASSLCCGSEPSTTTRLS